MTQGLKEGEPNGRDVYPDIIDLPHHQSPTRNRMSLYDRAAQFSAFDALAGYTDMVAEEQRLTDTQIELEENGLERLNQKLGLIADVKADGHKPSLTITYFVPDEKKAGGSYTTVTDTVKKIDSIARKIVLMSTEGRAGLNKTIDFDRVINITGELVGRGKSWIQAEYGVTCGLLLHSRLSYPALASSRILSSHPRLRGSDIKRPCPRWADQNVQPVQARVVRSLVSRSGLAAEVDAGRVRRETGCECRIEQYNMDTKNRESDRSCVH